MTTHACTGWDFRMNSSDEYDYTKIIEQLSILSKSFVFQLEQGEQNGYIHYQGRFSLIKKHRKSELMKMFNIIPVPNYLEPSVKTTFYTGDMFYVMKTETRIDGPWSDKDIKKDVYIPRQYRLEFNSLYPYQQFIFNSATVFDTRTINLIYDPLGNNGKSTIASYCELYGKGIDLPPVNDGQQLIQATCDICYGKDLRDPSPIFFDLPRAMTKDNLNGLYTAIEQIKKGKLVDLRYKYKEWWIDSPQIWVFTNIEPNLNLLSRDRWVIWTIDKDAFNNVKGIYTHNSVRKDKSDIYPCPRFIDMLKNL